MGNVMLKTQQPSVNCFKKMQRGKKKEVEPKV